MIAPNAANQCISCLASSVDLKATVARGPGGSDEICIYQCRTCRKFQNTPKHYMFADPESPELLSIALKHIPAIQNGNSSSSSGSPLQLVDASWIWTEPHSMRLRIRLTVRTEIQNVLVEQRVPVELKIRWQMCPECNREFTNRTWHALVQLRQHRDEGPKKGLRALEMVIAKHPELRKHVLKIDTSKYGLDFYFHELHRANAFAAFLQRNYPMRKVQRTSQVVSTDIKNHTTNTKTTIHCDLVQFCKHDLMYIEKKQVHGSFAGKTVVVTKLTHNFIYVMDAAPRSTVDKNHQLTYEIPVELYSKAEKKFHLLETSRRFVRFVVLDVEIATTTSQNVNSTTTHNHLDAVSSASQAGTNNNNKYVWAEVEVARESDMGCNDVTFRVTTVLGNLLSAGDIVLGYDLTTTSYEHQLADATNDEYHHRNNGGTIQLPDVILVQKVAGVSASRLNHIYDDTNHDHNVQNNRASSPKQQRLTKAKQRRRVRKEGKRRKELERAAVRMGFFDEEKEEDEGEDNDGMMEASENKVPEALSEELDAELEAEVKALERDLAKLHMPETATPSEPKKTERSTIAVEK
jgi:nonsense-mediated mRNA decay protein 3